MAKRFGCGDVVQGCKFTVTAENEAELMAAVAKHAAEAHGIPQVTPELAAQIKARIRDA